jgi:Holliday junction resolvase RusA-like endonuclease
MRRRRRKRACLITTRQQVRSLSPLDGYFAARRAALDQNHLYKTACRGNVPTVYLSPEGKQLKRDYHLDARSQWGRRAPIKDEVGLGVTLYFGTKRNADIDNYHKLSVDALTGVVYEDDSQVQALHVEKRYDNNNPRIEIEIVG